MLARDINHITRERSAAPHIPEIMLNRARWNEAFAGTRQQDATEAFQFLLVACDNVDAAALRNLPQYRGLPHREFQHSAVRASTPYNQIFANLQLIRITCTACNGTSELYERETVLNLSLENERLTTLHALLTEHHARENLDSAYRCLNCQELGRCNKITHVQQWPSVLAVAFKRFRFHRRTLTRSKVNRRIEYPLQYLPQAGVQYNLRALIEHQGVAGGGHYVAYVRGCSDEWYLCNDRCVSQDRRNVQQILQTQAYMLFYERSES